MTRLRKNLLTIGEAAAYIGVSEQTLRRWHADGTMPASFVSAGAHRFYTMSDLEKRTKGILQMAKEWSWSEAPSVPADEFYCSTSDRFKTRLERLATEMDALPKLQEISSLVTLIAGEIGNNSFDHNLGNWPDVPGIFFSHDLGKRQLVLADRGQGVLTTLRCTKPELKDDAEALHMAFTEVVTGRAPEHRGNGLKSVMSAVYLLNGRLTFQSGTAELAIDGRKKNYKIMPDQAPLRGCRCWLEFR